MMIRALAVLVMGVGIATAVPTVSASGPAALAVTLRPSDARGGVVQGPGYFVLSARAGSTTKLYAFLGNLGAQKAAVLLASVDASSGALGGISYNLPQQPRRLVGSWVRLPVTRAKLPGGRAEVIPFTITVPAHVKPGQYVGGLSAYVPAQRVQKRGIIAIRVQTRVVVAIQVNVPGPLHPRFVVTHVSARQRPDGTYLTTSIRNAGNELLRGRGIIWVTHPGTKGVVLQSRMSLDMTLPDTAVPYPVRWSGHPKPGRYRAHVLFWWHGGKTSR